MGGNKYWKAANARIVESTTYGIPPIAFLFFDDIPFLKDLHRGLSFMEYPTKVSTFGP